MSKISILLGEGNTPSSPSEETRICKQKIWKFPLQERVYGKNIVKWVFGRKFLSIHVVYKLSTNLRKIKEKSFQRMLVLFLLYCISFWCKCAR